MALTDVDFEEIEQEVDGTTISGPYRTQLLENVIITEEEAEIALNDTRSEDWYDDLLNEGAYQTLSADAAGATRNGSSSIIKSPCLSSDNTGGTQQDGAGGAGGAGGGAGGAGGEQPKPKPNTAGPGWYNVKDLNLGDNGVAALIKIEGIRYTVYDDKTGKPVASYGDVKGFATIGIGHLIGAGEQTKFAPYLLGANPGKMTKEAVYALKRADVPRYTGVLYKKITQPITQNMFDALTMLSFNTGPGGVTIKKAISLINERKYRDAADAIKNGTNTSKGVVMAGLTRRRKEESELFIKDIPTA